MPPGAQPENHDRLLGSVPGPRYHRLKDYLAHRFGGRVSKISLDAGLTCPNRDGFLSTKGCIFCDASGSGTGLADQGLTIPAQMARALAHAPTERRFIAYFQSYTNTYASLSDLRALWDQALTFPGVIGLSIGTRPDCLPDEVLDLLAAYRSRVEVWLELGLQSAVESTLVAINRGHTAADFAQAVVRAHSRKIEVVAHVIIGLPGEMESEILETARFVNRCGVQGVKIHSLYVVKGTPLAELYERGSYRPLEQDEYVRLVVVFLENLPPGTVIHRLTGDPRPETLLAPSWTLDKNRTIASIHARMAVQGTWQGRALGAPWAAIGDNR